jgi:glyoxylase-like metal-dependent hydrolase (beta-lactamase superfamily II)
MSPIKTPTLPPATHTNAYVLGETDVIVVDPGSPDPEEIDRLLRGLKKRKLRLHAVVLTHHHADHIGGCALIAQRLGGIPIWAHSETARLLSDRLHIDRHLMDGELLKVGKHHFEVPSSIKGSHGWRHGCGSRLHLH